MVSQGTKGRCGACLKGFQSRRAQFLKISIPLSPILRVDTTWLLFERESGSSGQAALGEQGERKAGRGRGGGQMSGNRLQGALRLLICAEGKRKHSSVAAGAYARGLM